MKIIKKYWSLFFLFFIWVIFAAPYFVKSKILFPSTYLTSFFSPWNNYQIFTGPVKNNAMPDIISQIYPWKTLVIDTFRLGEIPLWNPYTFSGTPLLANYQSAVFSPFNLLFFILPFVNAWNLVILLQSFLAGLFMYLLSRAYNLSKTSSLISSISFMFCGFITVWMGYGTLGYAVLYLPLAFYAIEKFLKNHKKRFLALLSLSVLLSFVSGHFQISVYFFITVFFYILFKFFTSKNKKNSVLLLIYFLIGVLLAMPQILPSIELYNQSVRSGIFQKIEAIPLSYIATLFAPDYFGNPVTRNDWFGHYAEWAGYIGILPLMLAFYSILGKKNLQTIYLFLFGILVLLLAFNTPLLTLLVNLHVPVLSTSAASRIIVIFSFIFSLLAAFGMEDLLKDVKSKEHFKKIFIWLFLFFVVFVFLWVVVVFKLFIPLDKISIALKNLILPSALFIGSSFAILLMVFYKNKSVFKFFILMLLLTISFDMLRFTTKWQPFDQKELVYPNVPVAKELEKISSYERVFGNIGGEAFMYYKLPSLEGYDALYLKRYGEFIKAIDDGKIKDPDRSVVVFSRQGKYAEKALDLLGVRYLVHKVSDGRDPWAFPFWNYDKQFKLIYKDNNFELYENKKALPRVFLAGDYKVINENQKIIDTIFSKDFDLRKTLVLEEDPGVLTKSGNLGIAEITIYNPNRVIITVKAKENSLLFLSDNYYKGWMAYLDGKNIPILRANYSFRAIPVTKGNHRAEFLYEPSSFKLGLIFALVGDRKSVV